MPELAQNPLPPTRLPWSLTLAALVAFSALYFTTQGFFGLPLLGLMLLASQFTDRRLPSNKAIITPLRVGVFAVIVIVIGFPQNSVRLWYLDNEYTDVLGSILAAEMVIRAWEPSNLPKRSDRRGMAIFMASLVFAAGCNTLDAGYIPTLAPIFVVLIMICLRSFLPGGRGQAALTGMRLIAGVMVIVLGFVIIQTVVGLDNEIQLLAARFMRRAPRQSDIGLTLSPRMGPTFNPEPSMSRVLVIEGPRREQHLRVLSFDDYLNNMWYPTVRDGDRGFHAVRSTLLITREPGARLEFRLVGDTYDLLPLPLNAAAVESAEDLDQERNGSLRFHNSVAGGRYEATVAANDRFQGPLSLPLDEKMRGRDLALPKEMDPRVLELAKEAAGQGPPLTQAIRIIQHLQKQHRYSLSYTPSSDDPLAEFILGDSAAHCQFFASAMVIMSRAVGIPSRLVTGYYAHEADGDDYMVVRDRDAHAWAECWIDGVGWMTMEATPPGGRPDAISPAPSRLRRIWESIADFPTVLQRWFDRLSRQMVLMVILALAAMVLAAGLVRLLRSRRRSGPMPYAAPDPLLVPLVKRFEKWLTRRGAACAANTTWLEHARASNQPRQCVQFIETYEEARFGRVDRTLIARLNEILDGLETAKVEPRTNADEHGKDMQE